MKLSFVIPAYNEEKYIGRCLDSIHGELRGKNHEVEIIVVNNASTDRTHEVAASFDGVKVVYESQKGLTKARSAGFQASSGDLIANIDADTMLTSGWLEKAFQEFSANENLVALSGPHIYYELSGIKKGMINFWYRMSYLLHTINHKYLKKGAVLQGGNFVLRRTALEKIGGYDLKFDFYGEDTDVARRIYKVGQVKFTLGFPIYASARRLNSEGLIAMGVRYTMNHFWTLFFKKPFTKTFKDVRS